MNGVLNFLKPPGMTSHDAVAFVRRVLKTRRVGHTGTLDPAAAGVLPICVGQATRLVENLQSGEKEYLAEATFGFQTDTLDQCGQTIRKCDASSLDLQTLRRALDNFRGEITQTPPLFSAIKVDGQKLYDLAREGKTVEIPTRQVKISHLQVEKWFPGEQPKAFLRVRCGGGTYIRSLVRDIGENLGLCATMTFLLRTQSGVFTIENAVTPQEFEASRELISLEDVLSQLTPFKVENDAQTHALWQGKQVEFKPRILAELTKKTALEKGIGLLLAQKQIEASIFFHNSEKTIFALAKLSETAGFYRAEKVFDLREKS